MRQYLELVNDVLKNGRLRKTDAQGIGNIAVFVRTMRFDLSEGFPLMTTKKINFKYVLGELLWFLRGDSRVDFLHENNIPIWDTWATKECCDLYGLEEGDCGRIYGPQWIHWLCRDGKEINQIQRLVNGLINNPDSKRHKVVAYNPEDIDSVFVAPCHGDFKCFVADGVLDLHLCQRSADVPIGVPFNIPSYAMLLMMLAQVTGLKAGELIVTTQDTHIYLNQIEPMKIQMEREPKKLPALKLNPDIKNIFEFGLDDFELEGYNPDPFIKIPVGR